MSLELYRLQLRLQQNQINTSHISIGLNMSKSPKLWFLLGLLAFITACSVGILPRRDGVVALYSVLESLLAGICIFNGLLKAIGQEASEQEITGAP